MLRYYRGMTHQTFSKKLDTWLKGNTKQTLGSLREVFAEKSFAILMLLLMALPALPIPTGGVTHVTELITMLLALEMIIGLRDPWLPKRWQKMQVGNVMKKRALPFLVKRIAWLERFAMPRLSGLLDKAVFRTLTGLIILLFTIGAFVAPPFSGLDTLPAMGVVIIALALILEDILLYLVGCIVGAFGIGLVAVLGKATITIFKHLF